MFSLHETTKTWLCRAAFIGFACAPTVMVLAWCLVAGSDWYRRAHEQAIATQLGLSTRLAAVSLPRPRLVLYRELELADPNNGQLLARLPFVEIESRGEVTEVRLPFPAIVNGTRFDALWQVVHDLARPAAAIGRVQFSAQNLTVHLVSGDQTLTDVVAQIDGDGVQTMAQASFRRADGLAGSEPCEVFVTRRLHAGATVHAVELSTGAASLPSSAIASIWPGVERLGKKCEFSGRLAAFEQGGAWRTELQGRLSGIELDLVMRPFRHKLTGVAEAQLDRLVIAGGRMETAAGNVTAGPGVISRSLVQSAETHLHIRATDFALRGVGNLLEYERLCAGFELGPQGLTLRGAVPQTRGGLLVDAQRILVHEPPVISQPVVDLVRTLVPQSEVQVPATRETVILTSALPVPSIMPQPGHEEPLPQARPLNVKPRPLDAGPPVGNGNYRR
jgi:hypothetical protein